MDTNKNDNNKDYNCFEKLILRYSDISAISLFISPFMFLMLLKLGEIRIHIHGKNEIYLNGLLLVFIIPYTIGIMISLLKISLQKEFSKKNKIWLLVAFIFYAFSYFTVFIDSNSKLNALIIIGFIVFALINSILITYILESIFFSLKNWIFKLDDNKDLEIVKYRLSFLNKLIIGFISIVASILGVILTLKNILS